MLRTLTTATCALLSLTGAWAQVVFNSMAVRTTDGQIHTYDISQVDSITFEHEPSVQADKWYHMLENPGVADYLRDFDYDPADYSYHRLFDYRGAPYLDTRQDWPYGVTLGDTTFYNLMPGKAYRLEGFYGGKATTMTIRTLGRLRMIRAEGADNIRDLGGWPVGDNRRIRYGLIYRGTELNTAFAPVPDYARSAHSLTAEDQRMFREDLGIRAELDLRGARENPASGTSALGRDVAYANYNINYGEISSPANRSLLLSCFRFIASEIEKEHPVYIHCVWGADRTGMLCMLLEGLLGVAQSDLDKDYELTSFSGNTRYRTDAAYRDVISQITTFDGQTLQDKFRTCWRLFGATDAEIDHFIMMMTEPMDD